MIGGTSDWANFLVQECQKAFHHFLPLAENERAFLNNLLDNAIKYTDGKMPILIQLSSELNKIFFLLEM